MATTADREAATAIVDNISQCDDDDCITCDPCDEKAIASILSLIDEVREADAKVCDAVAKSYSGGTFNDSSREVRAAEECAAAIRKGEV